MDQDFSQGEVSGATALKAPVLVAGHLRIDIATWPSMSARAIANLMSEGVVDLASFRPRKVESFEFDV